MNDRKIIKFVFIGQLLRCTTIAHLLAYFEYATQWVFCTPCIYLAKNKFWLATLFGTKFPRPLTSFGGRRRFIRVVRGVRGVRGALKVIVNCQFSASPLSNL